MFDLSSLNEQAKLIDTEELHKYILGKVKCGEYTTCLDALIDYVEDESVEIEDVVSCISPTLKEILYKEACSRNLIKNPNISDVFDNLF